MNEAAWQRLEFNKVKDKVRDYALSYVGKQHVDQMKPSTQLKLVKQMIEETAEAVTVLKGGASVPIPSLQGIDNVLALLGTGYVYSEQDFANLYTFLHSCTQLKKYMESKQHIAPIVSSYAGSLYELSVLKSEIERCLRNGRIQDMASKDLNKVRKKIVIIEDRVKTRINGLMTKHSNIMQESLIAMRGERYVLPIKKEYRKLVQGAVLDESSSGQTVYIEPSELSQLHHELQALRGEESREEMKILGLLTELAEQSQYELNINVETVGAYDFLFAKAKYSYSIGGSSVELNDRGVVHIDGGTHPLLGRDTVPLTFTIGTNYRTLIITGPNTGGKTVALKTVGLLTLMVQSGLLVPVQRRSMFAVFHHVFADIGDGQSLEQSLSTFSAHISNVIHVLKHANDSTLVLIDELATGTDPGEGVALSIAVLEELYRRGSTVIATTHYNEIKHHATKTTGFQNARMEFDAITLKPRYQLTIGEAGRSYAFQIALNLGMSQKLIQRSEQLLSERDGTASLSAEQVTSKPSEALQDNGVERVAPAVITAAIFEDEVPEVRIQASEASQSTEQASEAYIPRPLELGDCVYVAYLKCTGIVCEVEDHKGNVGVLVKKQRFKINKKRLKLHISKDDLYPEDYDFDIIFETKENRKKKHLMKRKHVEGLSIIRESDS